MHNIKQITVHEDPHLDEIFSIGAIRHWFPEKAEDRWPGSSTAQIGFLSSGCLLGRDEEDYPEHLFIGCGKGKNALLDEHRRNLKSKKPECAATLVAKALGIIGLPEFRITTSAILQEDRYGDKDPFHIANIVKLMHAVQRPLPIDSLVLWVRDAYGCVLDDLQRSQPFMDGNKHTIRNIHTLMCRQEKHDADLWISLGNQALQEKTRRQKEAKPIVEASPVEVIKTAYGDAKLIVVHSDNDQVASEAWSRQLDVLIRVQSSGNVQIMTRSKRQMDLCKVTALIRAEELKLRGLPTVALSRLRSVDMVDEVPIWHLMETGERLFNGCNTARGVEPTVITPPRLAELVKIGLA